MSGVLTQVDAGHATVRTPDHQIDLLHRNDAWIAPDASETLRVKKIGQGVSVFGQTTWHFTIPDPLASEASTQTAGNVIEAPMPGAIRAVFSKAGQAVKVGDRLVVLEAMKMEHVLAAPRDGVIKEVLVSEGDQVAIGAPLVLMHDNEDDSGNG